MEYKYVVDRWDNVIFIGSVDECMEYMNSHHEAVAIRDTRYRKNVIEMKVMEMENRR